jgi:hypothetical protein
MPELVDAPKYLHIAEKMLDFNLTQDNVPDVSGLRTLLTLIGAYVSIGNDGKGDFHSTQVIAAVIALHQKNATLANRLERAEQKIAELSASIADYPGYDGASP